jgi:hypothetical protein
MEKDNLTEKQNPDWALFLPALSTFYITGLGKQRKGENYFPNDRIPQGISDLESLNFLNSQKALFPYKWALYSAGHAELDPKKQGNSESIVYERESGTFLLGDSGGFQILKGQWPADWKDPNCPKALEKRKAVLQWMDTYMDYGMCLDVPSQSFLNTDAIPLHNIHNIQDAITATHINNEYFINNRSGKCKFLNVLQGTNHTESYEWYEEMKKYCDPNLYPEKHFNGWAFGGQTKIDIHLTLIRLIDIIYDGLLQEGKHDLIHCLGVSILEYAVLFTDIQKAIRKYHNPKLQITFDCASPFFSAAKGLAYCETSIEHDSKWSYRMSKTAEDKKYATDNRKFVDAVLDDKVHNVFTNSPIVDKLLIKDVCYRGVGFIGQHGKETKTSWDTLSYTLIQAHNVYQHIAAVQEANRRYDNDIIPAMIRHKFIEKKFKEIINEVFAQKTKQESLDVVEKYSKLWEQMQAGSQGFSGKKTVNARTMYNKLVEEETQQNLSSNTKKQKPKNEKSSTIDSTIDQFVSFD